MASPGTSILLISVFKSSKIGGVSSHSSALAEGLERSGWEVWRIDFGEISAPRRLASAPSLLGASWRAALRLLRYRRRGGRIVHIHGSNRALPFRLLAPLLHRMGFKVILSLHSGLGYSNYLAEHPRQARVMDRRLRHAERLLFMNEPEVRKVAELLPAHAHRITKIHPFVKPPPSELPPMDHALAGEPFVVTAIGLWAQRYHYEEAVLAAHRLAERHSLRVEMRVIAGTSALEAAYRARITELLERLAQASDTFTYAIVEDCETVLAELATSSVLIRPARLDSYGLVLAEALLVGTPAIATDVCERVAGTILYTAGDTGRLDEALDEVYERRPAERVSLLPEGEDALSDYVGLYEGLLRG